MLRACDRVTSMCARLWCGSKFDLCSHPAALVVVVAMGQVGGKFIQLMTLPMNMNSLRFKVRAVLCVS